MNSYSVIPIEPGSETSRWWIFIFDQATTIPVYLLKEAVPGTGSKTVAGYLLIWLITEGELQIHKDQKEFSVPLWFFLPLFTPNSLRNGENSEGGSVL